MMKNMLRCKTNQQEHGWTQDGEMNKRDEGEKETKQDVDEVGPSRMWSMKLHVAR